MKKQSTILWLTSCVALLCAGGLRLHAADGRNHRTTISLNGQWEVEDSTTPDGVPKAYGHKAPVPGLTHSAIPAFPDVDEYQTRQLLSDMVQFGGLSKADYDKTAGVHGWSHQQRNYFWYRKTFDAPARKEVALLRMSL